MKIVVMTGVESGSRIRRKKRKFEQPSTSLASLSSLEKVRKYWRIMKMLLADTRKTIIMPR